MNLAYSITTSYNNVNPKRDGKSNIIKKEIKLRPPQQQGYMFEQFLEPRHCH